MSSDYIARLRAELVRAAERKQAGRRPWRAPRPLRPLIAAAAVALIALAVVVAADRRSDERPADPLDYSVGGGASEQAADVMRERLEAAGVRGATVSIGSDGRLEIGAPPESRADVDKLTQPGRLAMYDWETSVLGPDGEPAPADPGVTGGIDAGVSAAVSRAEAERRAAARPGARVVSTLAVVPDRWYAIAGEPALTNDEVASAEPIVDPAMGEPGVALEFTERGKAAFSALTRDVVRRGAAAGENQHFAIVIDDRIVSMPYIDYGDNPDGIDGSSGAQITGGLNGQSARRLAAMLESGPLPAELLPVSG